MAHWELAKKYDIIDFELGVKITGAGFPVYKGKGARLQRALISYFLVMQVMVKLELNLPWKPVLAWPCGVTYAVDPETFLITTYTESWDIASWGVSKNIHFHISFPQF